MKERKPWTIYFRRHTTQRFKIWMNTYFPRQFWLSSQPFFLRMKSHFCTYRFLGHAHWRHTQTGCPRWWQNTFQIQTLDQPHTPETKHESNQKGALQKIKQHRRADQSRETSARPTKPKRRAQLFLFRTQHTLRYCYGVVPQCLSVLYVLYVHNSSVRVWCTRIL